LDSETGELLRGRVDATPGAERFRGREVHVALEACALFVARALEQSGAVAHLAEPVETHALRGRKRSERAG
jgi:hypothetical protein